MTDIIAEQVVDAFAPPPEPVWPGVLVILTGSGILLALGFAACLGYQEARRVTEFQQLAEVTRSGLSVATQCMSTLQEVTPGAFVLWHQQGAAPRQVSAAVRDSARERRWTSP